jgi:hypothetical protein
MSFFNYFKDTLNYFYSQDKNQDFKIDYEMRLK